MIEKPFSTYKIQLDKKFKIYQIKKFIRWI